MVNYYCNICNSAITPSTPSIRCAKCKKYCHSKCTGLDINSLASCPEWTCHSCFTSLPVPDGSLTFSSIERLIEQQFIKLKVDLTHELSQIINDKFQQINDRVLLIENSVHSLQSDVKTLQDSLKKTEVSLNVKNTNAEVLTCRLYKSPSPRERQK